MDIKCEENVLLLILIVINNMYFVRPSQSICAFTSTESASAMEETGSAQVSSREKDGGNDVNTVIYCCQNTVWQLDFEKILVTRHIAYPPLFRIG
mmetsp:Transcript_9808/g.16651  ORF Transcript_9808/g.16651 Transcript_9808/m.16651 type:complete len:95 (-) Transcript_9808:92-376(-)